MVDLDRAELFAHRSRYQPPGDVAAFWRDTLAEAAARDGRTGRRIRRNNRARTRPKESEQS